MIVVAHFIVSLTHPSPTLIKSALYLSIMDSQTIFAKLFILRHILYN